MTNSQLAAVRKVMNQFPGLRIVKEGETLTPVSPGNPPFYGYSLEVTGSMSESEITNRMARLCAALNG